MLEEGGHCWFLVGCFCGGVVLTFPPCCSRAKLSSMILQWGKNLKRRALRFVHSLSNLSRSCVLTSIPSLPHRSLPLSDPSKCSWSMLLRHTGITLIQTMAPSELFPTYLLLGPIHPAIQLLIGWLTGRGLSHSSFQ